MKPRKRMCVFRLAIGMLCCILLASCASGSRSIEKKTTGIDVARYQGTIDWSRVGTSSVDFAMVRVGYRSMADGTLTEDSNARYNMQEATAHGIQLGVYFFSTATTEEEAKEEANWVAEIIAPYAVTYPVAFDCEGFNDPGSRQYGLSKEKRTDIALAFLKTIEKLGYEGMFYASKHDLENEWEMDRIDKTYKIWVAQYPEKPYPTTVRTSYEGKHHMWQYTTHGVVPGISQSVDMNVCYFGYPETAQPRSKDTPAEAFPDVEALMDFESVEEIVTAKDATNLRDIPSQGDDSNILYLMKNGEQATRIAVSPSGWSKVIFNGNVYYAVSSYLTTDLEYTAAPQYEEEAEDDGIQTRFIKVDEKVTAKDYVNVRTLPSVEHPDCKVIGQLKNGTVVRRTGINEEVGWSRIEFEGQTAYCVSSYLKVVD